MEKKKYSSKQLEEILDEVRTCTLFYITQNGTIDCPSAEEYLTWINQYSKYCIPEMAEDWKETIRKIIYSPLIPKPQYQNNSITKRLVKDNNYAIIDDLYNFMDAGKIMQTYDETKSWNEVDKIIKEQGHSGWTFSGVLNIMIQYSLIGTDFVDRYAPQRVNKSKDFKRIYDQSKNFIENRKKQNLKLVQVPLKKTN